MQVVSPSINAQTGTEFGKLHNSGIPEKGALILPGIPKYAFPSDSELDALGTDSTPGDGALPLPISDSQEFLLTPSSTYGFSSLDELATPDELCAAQASLNFVQVSFCI